MGLLGRLKGAIDEARFDVNRAGSLASMPIPGEAEIEMPAGGVRVTYEQAFTREGESGVEPTAPKAPQLPGLAVRGKKGSEPLEFKRFGGANLKSRKGKTRALVGTLVVPEARTYTVSAPEPFNSPEQENFQHLVLTSETKLLFDAV